MTRQARVLLTAFEAYGEWRQNASALALAASGELPSLAGVERRTYPVDHAELPRRLGDDLSAGYDWAIHLGQAPGRARIELEALALNLRSEAEVGEAATRPLEPGGPEALRCNAPVEAWALRLRAAGIPAAVSFHAGTFLCNAALYWSLRGVAQRGLATRCAFLHLPLAPEQVAERGEAQPSMPTDWVVRALDLLIGSLEAREGA